MKFKEGDWIVWDSDTKIFYEKIITINEEKGWYKYLDLETGVTIASWELDWLKDARLMTDEEKAELL